MSGPGSSTVADLLKRGAQLLASKRAETSAQLVSIKRGGVTTTNVPAGIARTQDLRDNGDVVVNDEVRDFKIAATDYRFSGVVSAPAEGDIIIDASSGTSLQYRVLPLVGEQAARWADPYGVTWRIHTKRKNG
jgi:hypothetical protein